MTDDPSELSAADKAQIRANLRLARQFVRELVETPERHSILPDSGTIVLLPPDDVGDAALTRANLNMAGQLHAQGRSPVVQAIGQEQLTGPQQLIRWRFGIPQEEAAISYDREQDVLLMAFAKTDRPTMPVRVHRYVTALIDPTTNRGISLTVPQFLTVVAPKSLALLDVLLKPSTLLIGITRDEVIDVRNSVALGRPLPTPDRTPVGEIINELARLAA